MPALPPSNTERWWMVYTVNGLTHRMLMRTGDGATAAVVNAVFAGLLTRMSADLYSLAPQNLEFALRGSNIRNTAAWTGAATYGGGTAISNDGRAAEYSFVGRTFQGHKARIFLYGAKLSAQGDYRISTSEDVAVDNALLFLNGATGAWLAVDGLQPVWKGYVNTGLNDHWVKRARSGA